MKASDFTDLRDRVDRTRFIRLTAARRFARQQRMSQWTVAWLSVALIVLALWPALDLPMRFSFLLVHAVEILFATLILTYSLLLNLDNYAIRSDRLHSCAVELGRLARKVETYLDSTDPKEYLALSNEYYDILSKYENHENVDFLLSRVEHPELYEKDFQGQKGFKYLRYWVWSWISYSAGFLHFFVIGLIVVAFILLMVFPS
jgi:hypothetical protein